MKNPLISIITPTYNHGKFIRDCIESVRKQTYGNWEMVIVDDNSSDDTGKIAKSYAMADQRIAYFSHKSNWGGGRIRDIYNEALGKTNGEFIAILEGDDFWPAYKLNIQRKVFMDKKVVLSYGDWIMTDDAGRGIHLRSYSTFNRNLLNNKPLGSIAGLYHTLRFDIGSPTVMMRKKALEQIGGFQKDRLYPFADIPTYLALGSKGTFGFVNEMLGYYRRHENSFWYAYAKKSRSMGREELYEFVDKFIKRRGINKTGGDPFPYIKERKRRRSQSIKLNEALFTANNDPLSLILRGTGRFAFYMQYLSYVLRKTFIS